MRERLGHAHQGVVDRRVAVRVVLAHHLADDALALDVAAVGAQAQLGHRVQDAALHRLEAVARVGQGAGVDDRVGVLEERALHLLLDVDVDDLLLEVLGWRRGGGATGHARVGLLACLAGGHPIFAQGAPGRHLPRRGRRPGDSVDTERPQWATSSTARRGRGAGWGSSARGSAYPMEHDPDDGAAGRDAEGRLDGVVVRRRHPEEEPAEPLVDGGEQDEQRRHAGVDVPVGDRPTRLVAVGPALVGLGISVEVGVLVGQAQRSARCRPYAAEPAVARAVPGRAVAPQNASRSSSSARTTKSQPWLKPALGARTALARHRSTTSSRNGPVGVVAPHHAAAPDDVGELHGDTLAPAGGQCDVEAGAVRRSQPLGPESDRARRAGHGTRAAASTTAAASSTTGSDAGFCGARAEGMTGHQLVEEDGADPQRPPEVEAACGHMVAVVSNSKAGSMDVVKPPAAGTGSTVGRTMPSRPDRRPRRAPVREVRCR